MKRKEAIHKIKYLLDNLNSICSTQLQSEAILNELEKVGMLPPKVQKIKKYNNIMEYIELVNEWEE